MMDLELFNGNNEEEVMKAIEAIPFGNSAFMITDLILQNESDSRNYRQVLLEIWEKYRALKEAEFRRSRYFINKEKKQKLLESEQDLIEKQLIQIDIDEADFQITIEDKLIKDAIVELNVYHAVYKQMPKLTREEFEQQEPEFHRKKAIRQAERDVLSNNTISPGNTEYLSKLKMNPYQVQHDLLKLKTDDALNRVEQLAPSIPTL